LTNPETKALPDLRFPEFNDQWGSSAMGKIYPQIRNGFVGTATPFYCDQGVQYVQGRNIKAGKIQQNGFVSITEAFHQKCSKSQLRTDDILMVQSGHVGECAVVTKDFDDANCHALLVLTPKEKTADSRFYVSYYYSPFGRRRIHTIKTGNTVAHILSSDLKKVSVPKPNLPEQRKIADFLTAVDGRIGQLTQKKALLEDYKKGVMQQLFTQAIRFKDDHGNDFPDWEEKKFTDIFVFSTGMNIKQAEASPDFAIPCVRYGELYHMYREVISTVINRTNLDRSELTFSDGDEILLPSAGEDPLDIGSASALMIKNVAIGRTINVLKPKDVGIYEQRFVSYYINQMLRKKISTLARGASISNVYNSDLKKLVIQLPSLPEQTKIANYLSVMERKIESVATQITETQTFKKGLLQQMFV
jgi:type I restriction enzyme, S subunit